MSDTKLQSYYRRWQAAEREVRRLERELEAARRKAAGLRGRVGRTLAEAGR